MRLIRRMVDAAGSLSIFAGGVLTAAAAGPTSALSDWGQPCNLPSVTANAPVVHDAQIQLVNDCESVSDGSSCSVCGDCAAAYDCCYQPLWDVTAGAVFLNRSRPNPTVIATPPTGTPGTLISGSNFDFGWNAGPEITVTRRTDCGLLFQGRYFNDRSADANFDIPTVNTFRIAGIGVTILGGGFVDSEYTTQLDSAEFNVGIPLCQQWTLLAGFRWVELQDNLNVLIATPAIHTTWDEGNQLYGGQIGVDVHFTNPANRLQFSGVLKAGVFGDSAVNQLTSNIVGGASDQGTSTAFVGEADFYASYQLTRHFAVRGGYMVLWIQGVALADDAAQNTRQVAGGSSSPLPTNGDLWYNGANVALECKW